MFDPNKYRPNVAIVIANGSGQLFLAHRSDGRNWQFPQGGIAKGEQLEQSMYRELYEETGLSSQHVNIIQVTHGWFGYQFPAEIRHKKDTSYLGQQQKWFLLYLTTGDEYIDLNKCTNPEFDCWRWVSYWYPLQCIIDFKSLVYRSALIELSSAHTALVNSKLVKNYKFTQQPYDIL